MLEKPEVDAMITKALEELGSKPEVSLTLTLTLTLATQPLLLTTHHNYLPLRTTHHSLLTTYCRGR